MGSDTLIKTQLIIILYRLSIVSERIYMNNVLAALTLNLDSDGN